MTANLCQTRTSYVAELFMTNKVGSPERGNEPPSTSFPIPTSGLYAPVLRLGAGTTATVGEGKVILDTVTATFAGALPQSEIGIAEQWRPGAKIQPSPGSSLQIEEPLLTTS